MLDSVAIDVAEAAAAKQRYAGRLTRDLVEERLGMSLSAGPAGEPSPSLLRSSASEAAEWERRGMLSWSSGAPRSPAARCPA